MLANRVGGLLFTRINEEDHGLASIPRAELLNRGKAVFFLVYPGKKDTANSIRKHDREFGYTLAALRDPQHILVKQSQAQITPEAAVFDANPRPGFHRRVVNLYEEFGPRRKKPTQHEVSDRNETGIP